MDSRTEVNLDDRLAEIAGRGWTHARGQLSAAAVAELRGDIERIYEVCRAVQVRNGVAANQEGAAHHVLGYGGAVDAFVNDLPFYDLIEAYFDGKTILLNAGAALNPPNATTYTSRPHRDIRSFSPGFPLSLNMLVMLDDFTAQNGATLMLAGSQATPEMPAPEVFARDAVPVTGQAGDILLFDSLVVHAAGANRSEGPRRALTFCFGRPFMKPQMDWPRFLSAEAEARLSPVGRQLLGYHARVAASLDEYYQPAERWTFRPDQR